MPDQPALPLDALRAHARAHESAAVAPYSGQRIAAVVLLSDGAWVPGVRVESASFSLVIPALLNAVTTAIAAGRRDLVAAVQSRPMAAHTVTYLSALEPGPWRQHTPDAACRTAPYALPTPGDRLSPFLDAPPPTTPDAGLALARTVAERAYVPASRFPVGCVLETETGQLVPGVNVEHPDWSRILCAERNALGTAASYRTAAPRQMYLTCLLDAHGTPCGACRQLLAEQAGGLTIWMDRHAAPAEATTPDALVPGSFTGAALTPRA